LPGDTVCRTDEQKCNCSAYRLLVIHSPNKKKGGV